MKHFSSLAFFLLIGTCVLALTSLSFSFFVYSSLSRSSISAHSSEATIGLTVETAPGGTSCGDGTCNGVETCSTCSADCGACAGGGTGGGGGGGGGPPARPPNFVVANDNFNIQLVSGQSESHEIIVENKGLMTITVTLSVTGIGSYISFNTNTLTLAPGQKLPLTFTVLAPEPGVYAGKIILQYQGISREVLVLLNVVSEGVLFDATVTIPDLYRVLRLGQRLPTLIELTEVGGESGVDVTMNYIIKDFDGNVKYTESETFYVLGTKSFSKRFSTAGLDPGDYVLGVELVYPGGFATSSAHFKISDSLITPQTWIAFGAFLVAIIVVALSVTFYIRHRGERKPFKPQRVLS